MKKNIVFFHNSDRHWKKDKSLFKPRLRDGNLKKDTRPVFYWFSDIWFSHWPRTRDKYFYLFVKNPKKNEIELRSRSGSFDFDALLSEYVEYLQERKQKDLIDLHFNPDPKPPYKGYHEPPILMSFSEVVPDLVVHFSNERDKCGEIISSEPHKGRSICLFDKTGFPIKFTDIEEVVDIVPRIKNSYPFIQPRKSKGKFVYDDWVPMVTEKMGTWL